MRWIGFATALAIFGCSHAQPTPPEAPRYQNVPPHMLDTRATYRPEPHLPDAVKLKHPDEELISMLKVCVAPDGHVAQISLLQGIPGADAAIVETLRAWTFKPQPIPVCTLQRFVFFVPPPPRQP
jgi:hypothetical protein